MSMRSLKNRLEKLEQEKADLSYNDLSESEFKDIATPILADLVDYQELLELIETLENDLINDTTTNYDDLFNRYVEKYGMKSMSYDRQAVADLNAKRAKIAGISDSELDKEIIKLEIKAGFKQAK